MNRKKILVLGITGMLGHVLFLFLSKHKEFEVYGTSSLRGKKIINNIGKFKNFTNNIYFTKKNIFKSSISIIEKIKPHYIINCIGIIKQSTNINLVNETLLINSIFPNFLGIISKSYNFRLIHISTDCVFDGYRGNYTEKDKPDAKDIYGISKFRGEIKDNTSVLTLRTSIIGPELKSHLSLFSWLLSQKNNISGYKNAYFSGLTTIEFSNIIKCIINEHSNLHGLYNVSSKKISKHELLTLINKIYDLKIIITPKNIPNINRSLNSRKFYNYTKITVKSWNEMIKDQKRLYQEI